MADAKLTELIDELTEDMRTLTTINERWGRVRIVESDIPQRAMLAAGVPDGALKRRYSLFTDALRIFDDRMDATRSAADSLLFALTEINRAIKQHER